MTESSKLFIVVRSDLVPGLQAAQACHALDEFSAEHPELYASWHEKSKVLVLLGVAQESDLDGLAGCAERKGLRLARNFEPDLGGELTAVAFGPEAKSLLRPLSLLLREAA